MDAVLTVLKKYGWKDDGPLLVKLIDKKEKELPMFTFRRAVVLVGPVWTTYYHRPLVESEIASVRTEDLKKVERVITHLTQKAA